MKRALHRGGDDTLNIYLTTAGVYLGWAYLPSITEQGNSYLDGIVVDWESMLGTSDRYAGRYDKGETATHEAGHWLNLEHTFFHGCNGEGDFVDDTPYMSVPTNGCPARQGHLHRSPASTRSTTTWTTRTTRATRSSPPARQSGCRTPGSSTALRKSNAVSESTGPPRAGPSVSGARLDAPRL